MRKGRPITLKTIRRAHWVAHKFYVAGMEHDDLVQEALVGAVEARRDYQPRVGAFSTFEVLCMRRRLMDAVNLALREKRGAGERTVELPQDLTTRDGYEPVIAARELLADIRRLPVREQRCLIALACGLTYDEIAQQEGVTVKTVDNDIYDARAALRRLAA